MKYVADIAAGELSADLINRCIDAYFEYCAIKLISGYNARIPGVGMIKLLKKKAHKRHNVYYGVVEFIGESVVTKIIPSSKMTYYLTNKRNKIYFDKSKGVSVDAVNYVALATGQKKITIKKALNDWGDAAVMTLIAGRVVACSNLGKLRVAVGKSDVWHGKWSLKWIVIELLDDIKAALQSVAPRAKA